MLKERLAKNIKAQRLKRDLTQEAFAELIGMSYEGYQKIELGKRSVSLKTIEKIAKALKIDPVRLFKKTPPFTSGALKL